MTQPRVTLMPFTDNPLMRCMGDLQGLAGGDPLILRRHVVLLPTHRAARFFQDQAPETCFLPHILTFGDEESPLPCIWRLHQPDAPRVLGEAETLLRLSHLIHQHRAHDDPARIAPMARDFLRDAETYGVCEGALEVLSQYPLAKHWHQNRALMEVVLRHWPQHTQDNSIITPTLAQRLWLQDVAAFVAAGGYTLHVVGFLNDSPPFLEALKDLGSHLHLIVPWSGGDDKRCDATVRRMLSVLAPDVLTGAAAFPTPQADVFGFSLCPQPEAPKTLKVHRYDHALQEIRTTALSIKKIRTQQPDRAVSVVCTDAVFLQHLKSELQRYGLIPDDPVGTFWRTSPEGRFVLLWLDVLSQPLSLLSTADLLLHPLMVWHDEKGSLRRLGRALLAHHRNPLTLPPQTFDDLPFYRDTPVLQAMAQAHAAYRKAPHSLAAWDCFQSTLALFSGDVLPHDGPWQEIVMDVTRGLSSVAAPLSPSFLASVLRSRIAETILPTAQDQDTHIRLMGVYDAYGLTHDVLMVPVCVETVSQPTGERLAPMHVLRAMGFPVDDDDPRDAIMAFLMHQPDVTLSYTGAPGRLMQRVLWFYPDCLRLSPEAGLDPEGDHPFSAAPLPAPCPPLSARPTRFSVSDMELWQRNPYAFYAAKLLNLRPLRPLQGTSTPALYGTLMHQLLHAYVIQGNLSLPYDDTKALALCSRIFSDIRHHPFLVLFWTTKAMTLLRAFHQQEQTSPWQPVALEHKGQCHWTLNGQTYTLTARADRLDEDARGDVRIVDYKTGTPPPTGEILRGLVPALPLEGVILKNGGFDGFSNDKTIRAITYTHLRGIEDGSPLISKTLSGDLASLMENTETWMVAMIEAFANPQQPYLSIPHPDFPPAYDDYGHLGRGG
jgi:RecB family exonuclease